MVPPGTPEQPSLRTILDRLKAVIQAESEALAADNVGLLESLAPERAALVAALTLAAPHGIRPEDRALLEQVAALDQQLVASARADLERTGQELGEARRGRGALDAYGRRGQARIGGLALLDVQR